MLKQLIITARGIYLEKDYQLIRWANWLRKTNLTEQSSSFIKIKRFLQQVFSVEDFASGVDDALTIILQAVFDISPHQAIQMYKLLLERKIITHDEGIAKLPAVVLEI